MTIRGNTQTRLGDSSVALVVDGVQSLDQNNINQELLDVQQIEVLKGPQGALYGRNALGGAIVIATAPPNFDRWEGRVKLTGASGHEEDAQVSASGPVGAHFAVRGAVSYTDRQGFYRNDISGEHVDRFLDRIALLRGLWKLTDTVTGDFRVSGERMGGGGIAWNAILALPPSLGGNAPYLSGDNVSLPYVNDIRGFSSDDRFNASMKWDVDFGVARLTSVTSYFKGTDRYGSSSYPYFYQPGQFYLLFPGATPIGLGAQTQELLRESRVKAEELRLQSDRGALKWVVGVYYAKFLIDNVSTTGADTNGVLLGLGPYPFGSPNQTLSYLNDTNDNHAYAGFANLVYAIGAVELSASARHDREEKRQADRALPGAPVPADPKQIPTYLVRGWRSRSAQFSETQPKFSARWSITPDTAIYASWGRGFKTGGFNPFGTGALLRSFNPASTVGDVFPKEVADTWEVGLKGAWLDRRLTASAAYFDTKSRNAQLLEFFPQPTLQAISTANEVRMKGLELELQARPVEPLQLIVSYGYLDARVTRFAAQPSYVGNRRPSTAPYTFLGAIQYTQGIRGSGWTFVGRTDFTRTGTTTWDWSNTPGAARSPFSVLNARLALQNDHWQLAAWSKNLTDKLYNAEHIVLLPFAGALYRAPPRQYGVDAAYRF